jgi:hypothetical protein
MTFASAEFRWDLLSTGSDSRLYRLSEPLGGFEYVIVAAYLTGSGEPETYIFGADLNGNQVSWSELPGSLQGKTDHAAALARAGYRIAVDPTPTDDVRDLLDEANQRLVAWGTRHEPGHALDVRTSGREAVAALVEAVRLLNALAVATEEQVDAYDDQQVAFLHSVLRDGGQS